MLSSIKEFILDTIFSGKKRIRSQTSSKNLVEYAPTKFTDRKFYKLKSSGVKSLIKEKIIDISDDKFIPVDQKTKQITINEILQIKIQISSTEIEFYEKLNLFTNSKNDMNNYPPIGSSNFLKLIRYLY